MSHKFCSPPMHSSIVEFRNFPLCRSYTESRSRSGSLELPLLSWATRAINWLRQQSKLISVTNYLKSQSSNIVKSNNFRCWPLISLFFVQHQLLPRKLRVATSMTSNRQCKRLSSLCPFQSAVLPARPFHGSTDPLTV